MGEKTLDPRDEIHVAIILTVRAALTLRLAARRDQTETDRREETRDTETADPRQSEATPDVAGWRDFSVRVRHAPGSREKSERR